MKLKKEDLVTFQRFLRALSNADICESLIIPNTILTEFSVLALTILLLMLLTETIITKNIVTKTIKSHKSYISVACL